MIPSEQDSTDDESTGLPGSPEHEQGRPPIPRWLRRDVLVEAGHRCAIPACRSNPVDVHHIVPWAVVHGHTFDNLIALCPTCHSRVTKGEIDRKSVQTYKANLATVNRPSPGATVSPPEDRDSLTSLPNRRAFDERLAELGTDRRLVAVVCIDLDRMKPVNDRYGLKIGDAVIREIASRLLEATPKNGTAYRLAGDEFAVVMTELQSMVQAEQASRTLLDAISEEDVDPTLPGLVLTASAGVVVSHILRDPEILLKQAYEAMFQAKVTGGGAVAIYKVGP